MDEDNITQDTLTFLKEQQEYYKVDNVLLIIPSSKDIKKDIINSININEYSNNIKIIQSSKDSNSNLILEISPTQNTQSTQSKQLTTQLHSELNTKLNTELHSQKDIDHNTNTQLNTQIKEYIVLVKKIMNMVRDCKNVCHLGFIQTENENVLSSLNHQLRTPMNTITSGVSVLQINTTNAANKRILKHLLNSCLELNLYINDIMDFYLLKGDSMELEYTDFSLQTLLDEVNGFFESDIKKNNINYKYDINYKSSINTDYKRLKQILRYLMSNSIKFSKNEKIILDIKREKHKDKTHKNNKHTIIFTIIDTGGGIDESLRDKVWLPFYQVNEQWMTTQEGLGLGLSNSKLLSKQLGGDISFINSPYNSGTAIQFYINDNTIPKKRILPKLPFHRTLPSLPSKKLEKLERQQQQQDNIHSLKSTSNMDINNSKEILIIEDNVINSELLKLMLENKYRNQGKTYKISIINDARMVMNKLEGSREGYKNIYMDLKMPHVSGFELLQLIHKKSNLVKKYKNRIILITALAQDKETITLKQNPLVKNIIFKPIMMRDLLIK